MLAGKLKILISIGCFTFSTAWAEKPFEVPVNPEMQALAEKAAQVTIDEKTKKDVEKLMETIRSPEYQARVKAFQESVAKSAGVQFSATQDKNDVGDSPVNALGTASRVYVFISSAQSPLALRKTISDAARLRNVVLVLRGFIGGAKTVKPTMKFIADILKKDADCEGPSCELHAVEVNIDPIRFSRYGINRVPAVVYEPHEQFIGHCDGDALATKSDRLVVYGESSLQYALQMMHDAQPAEGLPDLIAKLEPIPWEQQEKNGPPKNDS